MAYEIRQSATLEHSSMYNYPPMWSPQLTLATRRRQLERWSTIVQGYCRQKRLWRLNLVDALSTELFRNSRLRKSIPLHEATQIIDWMTQAEGLRRAEWIGKSGEKSSAWIYWKRPEEWAETLLGWVEETGQKNTVLTLYELTDGDATLTQAFHGMDPEVLQRALQVLVSRGKAQVFGDGDQKGVKFF